MGYRTHHDVKGRTPHARVITFSFQMNGTGAPTTIRGAGVKTVVRNSVGTFTATFEDSYAGLHGWHAGVTRAGGAVFATQPTGAVTGFTFTYTELAAGVATPTDVTARVSLTLFLTDSSV